MTEAAVIDRDARRLAVLGGIAGLLPAALLFLVILLNSDGPIVKEGLFGDSVLVLVYMSPYLLVLIASPIRQPAARGGLLMALGFLSLVASFSSLAGVSVVLLPATVLIFMAAVKSLRVPERRLFLASLHSLVGLLCASMIVFSFIALFAFEADEPRCSTTIRPADGTVASRQVRPEIRTDGRTMTVAGPGPCTSDIISNPEAARALMVLGAAVSSFTVASLSSAAVGLVRAGRPQDSEPRHSSRTQRRIFPHLLREIPRPVCIETRNDKRRTLTLAVPCHSERSEKSRTRPSLGEILSPPEADSESWVCCGPFQIRLVASYPLSMVPL